MKALYEHNLSSILKKTVHGKIEGRLPAKEALSPQKMTIITAIFDERIETLPGVDETEKIQRKRDMKTKLAKIINHICTDDLQTPPLRKRKQNLD